MFASVEADVQDVDRQSTSAGLVAVALLCIKVVWWVWGISSVSYPFLAP
jgi:hypothetical protein